VGRGVLDLKDRDLRDEIKRKENSGSRSEFLEG